MVFASSWPKLSGGIVLSAWCTTKIVLLLHARARKKHLEIAGVTCTPWSSMNRGRFRKWFHSQTLPAMTFIHHMVVLSPSILVVENVRAFDTTVMMAPLVHGNKYRYHELAVNPLDMGLPSGRARKYIVTFNIAEITVVNSMGPEALYAHVFGKKLRLAANVYMIASLDELRWEKVKMGEAKGLTLGCSEAGRPWV